MKFIGYNVYLLVLCMILIFTSCSTVKETGTEAKVKPLWTDKNSLIIADEFVSQIDIDSISGSKPVFLIGRIESEGVSEEIVSGLEYDIELILMNTGNVLFIADKRTRDTERENRKIMSMFDSEEKFYSYCENLKVDKFVEGKVIGDMTDDIASSYTIALKLVDIKLKEIYVWQKTIAPPN